MNENKCSQADGPMCQKELCGYRLEETYWKYIALGPYCENSAFPMITLSTLTFCCQATLTLERQLTINCLNFCGMIGALTKIALHFDENKVKSVPRNILGT